MVEEKKRNVDRDMDCEGDVLLRGSAASSSSGVVPPAVEGVQQEQQEQPAPCHPTVTLVDGYALKLGPGTDENTRRHHYEREWVEYKRLEDSTLKAGELRAQYRHWKTLDPAFEGAWKKLVHDFEEGHRANSGGAHPAPSQDMSRKVRRTISPQVAL